MRSSDTLVVLSLLCLSACGASASSDWLEFVRRPATFVSDLLSRVTDTDTEPLQAKYTKDAERDRVRFLPGWGAELSFGFFSGYVEVDEDTGKNFFYILTESEDQVKNNPLVLWLNGGPGCSSIAGGFLTENGPFYPAIDGLSLVQNHNAWNRVANMIYLDTPAFIGFSYSETSDDKHASDNSTAADNLAFLHGFMKRFPQYEGRDLWIVGESYAGHYIPTLVEAIMQHNEDNHDDDVPKLNLKGYMIGNPDTDPLFDNRGRVEFWYSHAIISNATAKNISDKCDFSNLIIGPLDQVHYIDPGKNCSELVHKAQKEMGNINIYDIYMDVCEENDPDDPDNYVASKPIVKKQLPKPGSRIDPCVDKRAITYLNKREVQVALHVIDSDRRKMKMETCSNYMVYDKKSQLTSMVPIHQKMLSSKLKILIYSGDVDAMVPVLSTRQWIEAMDMPIVADWKPWIANTGQIGGYVVVYEHMTFVTIRHAGHMVPYTQGERGLHIFRRFLDGRKF